MTRTEKTQILNILHYYRGLIGVDRKKTSHLIKQMETVETQTK